MGKAANYQTDLKGIPDRIGEMPAGFETRYASSPKRQKNFIDGQIKRAGRAILEYIEGCKSGVSYDNPSQKLLRMDAADAAYQLAKSGLTWISAMAEVKNYITEKGANYGGHVKLAADILITEGFAVHGKREMDRIDFSILEIADSLAPGGSASGAESIGYRLAGKGEDIGKIRDRIRKLRGVVIDLDPVRESFDRGVQLYGEQQKRAKPD